VTEVFTGEMATRMSEFSPEFSAFLQRQIDLDLEQVPGRIKGLLRASHQLVQGFQVTQLEHGLQTATMAEKAGMDVDVVVAALCHDMGKVISTPNHAAIAAEMIKAFVSEEAYFVVKVHQDFEGIHYLASLGVDPLIRLRYRDHPAYELAERFADDWDERAFDPDGAMFPLEHFEPMIDEVFGRTPKMPEHWVPAASTC
jgi:predicted HD phosphohydrolase